MSETKFHYWMVWKDEQGRTWVNDPREVGRSDSPTDARRHHEMACKFGWVKEGMVDPEVSDLFVATLGGKSAVIAEGANRDALVKSGAVISRVSAYEERLMA
jgi:hypothetical protein